MEEDEERNLDYTLALRKLPPTITVEIPSKVTCRLLFIGPKSDNWLDLSLRNDNDDDIADSEEGAFESSVTTYSLATASQ